MPNQILLKCASRFSWLFIVLLLAGCTSTGTIDRTPATHFLEFIAKTKAEKQIKDYNTKAAEWEKIKATEDLGKILNFVANDSNFRVQWELVQHLDQSTRNELGWAQYRYDNVFIPDIKAAIQFSKLYQKAVTSQAYPSIAALVQFVIWHRTYEWALNDPAIIDKHEEAMFRNARFINTIEGYNDFLAWYPRGTRTDDVRSLRDREQIRLLEEQKRDQEVTKENHNQSPSIPSGSYPPVITSLYNLINDNQHTILYAAHLLAAFISGNVDQPHLNSDGSVDITQHILWHMRGISKQHQTDLRYMASYSDQNTLSSLPIEVVNETNNPRLVAFQGVETAKNKAITPLIEYILNKTSLPEKYKKLTKPFLEKIAQEASSVKYFVSLVVIYMVNEAD